MTMLAAPGCPSDSVMATALTSAVAKIAPTKISASVTICTGRSQYRRPGGSLELDVLDFGSVDRCVTNAAPPSASSTVLANRPASGNSATLRPTDSDAPAI